MSDSLGPGPTSFIFADPSGRRWPRLRRIFLFTIAIVFVGVVLFVQTLFVSPKLNLPLSLRQLKGQLKALQKQNPATIPPADQIPLWLKFSAARKALKKTASPVPAAHKSFAHEAQFAFYRNGDPYSYASLQQHSAQITHVCPEWMAIVDGLGTLQIDSDNRLPKFCAAHGVALLPLLTNLVGDT
jgi:hypothetical protein